MSKLFPLLCKTCMMPLVIDSTIWCHACRQKHHFSCAQGEFLMASCWVCCSLPCNELGCPGSVPPSDNNALSYVPSHQQVCSDEVSQYSRKANLARPREPQEDERPGNKKKKGKRTRAKWTEEEDGWLRRLTSKYGTANWPDVTQDLNSILNNRERTAKQCRERFLNHLDPQLKPGPYDQEDEQKLKEAHEKGFVGMGAWSKIREGFLPGRCDNSIKNYWNGLLSRTQKAYDLEIKRGRAFDREGSILFNYVMGLRRSNRLREPSDAPLTLTYQQSPFPTSTSGSMESFLLDINSFSSRESFSSTSTAGSPSSSNFEDDRVLSPVIGAHHPNSTTSRLSPLLTTHQLQISDHTQQTYSHIPFRSPRSDISSLTSTGSTSSSSSGFSFTSEQCHGNNNNQEY